MAADSNVLQALLALQKEHGHVLGDAIAQVSRALAVTEAEVMGVCSFYPELRGARRGRHVVRVCIGESCMANHCLRLLAALADELRIGFHATTADGRFTLDPVYCLGACGVSPTLTIDDDVYGRVCPNAVPRLLERYR